MKNMKRISALICLLAMVLSLSTFVLSGCDNQNDPTTEPTAGTTAATKPSETTGATENTDDGTTDYTISVSSIGGLPLAEVMLFVYSDEALENMAGWCTTDESGSATLSLPAKGGYWITVASAPDGYNIDGSYTFVGTNADIKLQSQVIDDPDLSNVTYTLGSVMHDFTITDTEGNSYTLSSLLEEKEMVMLNFWYTTCSYCVAEFPYMDSVYQRYQDKIEILAMNHDSRDTTEEVTAFRNEFYETYDSDPETTGGLAIPMCLENLGMQSAFGLEAYPTSVFIDRYGVICLIEAGGIPSETPFVNAFEHFTGDNYTQTLFTEGISGVTPRVEPDVEMPSSDEMSTALNSGDVTVTYAPETEGEDAKYSWPFVIGEKNGESCVYPANIGIDSSYATLYANVTLKAGEAIGFDYFASCESGMDVLYVLIDRKDIYTISGESSQWNTCYPWVALEDGEYELALCYLKDESTAAGDDTVYLKNLRVIPADEIDVATYIPRYCANNLKADGFGYEDYATVVYNEKDGYYHVGTADGPLLLANLMGQTRFSNESVYYIALPGGIAENAKEYYTDILPYCTMASNSEIYPYCTVNQELRELLETVAADVGLEQSENEWLQMCSYYDAYGTGGVQLADPIRGLSAASAIPAVMGEENYVTYNRVIMPRGLLYKFVPETSGVYRITSNSEYMMNGWVFKAENLLDRSEFYTYEHNERMYDDSLNVSMVLYLEAGEEYFIDIAYYDIYGVGTFTFEIEYIAETLNHFILASPGYSTFYEGDVNETVIGGIDVALGEDGYYHELLADGSLGSIVYVDFIGLNNIFNVSLLEMTGTSSFNFAVDENDQQILSYLAEFGDDYEAGFRELWGEDYDYYMEYFMVDEVVAGIYHGNGKDMTSVARKYANMAVAVTSPIERTGCVAVNKELGELLQMLMDKFYFQVENSWLKLCYYYDYLGPEPNK